MRFRAKKLGSLTIFVRFSQLKAKSTASDGRFSLSLSIDPKNCQRRKKLPHL